MSRKPLRREGRLLPPVPVVFALAQSIFAREPRVHAATRPSLRPHLFRGQAVKQSSGASRRETTDVFAHYVVQYADYAAPSRPARCHNEPMTGLNRVPFCFRDDRRG
jgi:hypothetical protein